MTQIFIPKYEGVEKGGVFTFSQYRKGDQVDEWAWWNLVPTVALDAMNDDFFNSGTSYANFYVGLFSNAYTPQADDLYSHIGTRFTEITAEYSESTRPAWTSNGSSASGLVSNSSSRATFTFTGSATINGGLLVTNNVKGDNSSGLLVAATAASPSKSASNGDELLVKYEFQASST